MSRPLKTVLNQDTMENATFSARVSVGDFKFNPDYVPAGSEVGLLSWNKADYTLNIDTGLGPVLQTGQESYVIVYNDTGFDIPNGSAVYPVGSVSGRPSVALANAETYVKILGEVLITTMLIPDGEEGITTQFGKVRDIDTDSWDVGDTLWVGDTDGALTNVRPEFPCYAIQVGGVLVKDPSAGIIIVTVKGTPEDTTVNFWNGTFRETIAFTVVSNGSVVTGTLQPDNGHEDMTMMFSDGFTMLDTSPPIDIVLTAGTDDNPQMNYVYVLESTKTLTVSTSDWPVNEEHIKVANVLLRSAATTQLDGALGNRNWNDHIENTTTFQGHLSHINEKLRKFEAQWDSGVEGAVDIDSAPSPDAVTVRTTAGVIYQMHRQAFPSLDMTQYTIDALSQGSKTFTISDDGDLSSVFLDDSKFKINNSTGNDGTYVVDSTVWSSPDFIITVVESIPSAVADGTIGDDIHIVNDPVAPYQTTINLATEVVDALGASLVNKSFSFVVWGVQNKTGEAQHLMLNLPTGSYLRLSPDTAVSDADNYSVYDIPSDFQGIGFLIARFTFQLDATGLIWTLYDTQDLTGKVPNITAGGGGGGGGGASTFLGLTDTPSSYAGFENSFPKINSGGTAVEFLSSLTWEGDELVITQVDDSKGLKVIGFDDHDDKNLTLGINDEGKAFLNASFGGIRFSIIDERLFDFTGASFIGKQTTGRGFYIWNDVLYSSTIPTYSFRGDTDTGVGRADADQLSLTAGGVEGMRIVEDTTISMHLPETTTPTAIPNYAGVYPKADNKLYFQDGAGVEHEVALVP